MSTNKFSKTHIALIGCGRWGQYILRDLKLLGCEVTVVCRSQASIDRATLYQANHIISDWNSLPNSIDGIVIATQTSNHFQMIQNLAHHNKPIFVEKLSSLNLLEAESLLILQGQLFGTNKFSFHNGILQLKRICEQKVLGKLLGLKIKSYRWGISHDDTDVLTILLPHELSIMFEILGRFPKLRTVNFDRWNTDKVQLNTFFADKIFAQIDISTFEPSPIREIKLICEKGIAVLSGISSNRILIYPCLNNFSEDDIQEISFTTNQPLFDEIQKFIGFLQGGQQPKGNIMNAFEQVKLIHEIKKNCY